MPHIQVVYSSNLECEINFREFCELLRDSAVGTGIFPLEGIRVRAIRCDHYVVADGESGNGFVDITVRLRGGRSMEARKSATDEMFAAALSYLQQLLDSRPTALSFEMQDIDPELSPTANSIRRPGIT